MNDKRASCCVFQGLSFYCQVQCEYTPIKSRTIAEFSGHTTGSKWQKIYTRFGGIYCTLFQNMTDEECWSPYAEVMANSDLSEVRTAEFWWLCATAEVNHTSFNKLCLNFFNSCQALSCLARIEPVSGLLSHQIYMLSHIFSVTGLRVALSEGYNRLGNFLAWRRKQSRLPKRSTSLKN